MVSYNQLYDEADKRFILEPINKACFFIDNYKAIESTAEKRRAVKLIEGIVEGLIDEADKELIINRLREESGIKLRSKQKIRINTGTLLVTNFTDNVKKFYEQQPFFYDRNKIFWFWIETQNRWVIVDEIDLMKDIENALVFSGETVSSNIKSGYIEAIKRLGRDNIPKDPSPYWIQFSDKIVDVKTGDTFEASPEYFFTNPIPHQLGNSIETPNIDRLLIEWVGEDYLKTMHQIMAFSMLPCYPINRLFCFIGGGNNGKSCFLRIVTNLIGSYNTTSTELDTLITSRFEATKLHKKLVCQMGETNFAEFTKTSLLKRLTGQDMIGFEYKNKTPFDDYNYAKIFIATNSLPITMDKTIGFYRRWLLIDFPHQFTEQKDILISIPKEEYNNFCLKSLDILRELIEKREFDKEGDVEERKRRYEEKSNPFSKFFTDNIKMEYGCHISKKQFKEKMDQWFKERGYRLLSERTVAHLMVEREIEEQKVTANYLAEGKQIQYRAWWGINWS